MRKLLALMLTAVIVATVVAGGCVRLAPASEPPSAPTKTLDVGVVAALTGAVAFMGTNLQNAILLAIDDQNAEGGVTIAGQKYMLNPIIRDSKLDVVVGKNIAEELIYDKKVKVIAGPGVGDAVGAQIVTEKNKVMFFAAFAAVPGLCTPNKPYSFFPGGFPLMCLVPGAAYIQKFHPEAKTVFSMVADIPDVPQWLDAMKTVLPLYGLNSLGYEKVPLTTNDFMPIISRVLRKDPDIIDTSSTGSTLGAASALLVKQLGEAGFKGFIWCPTAPPPDVMMEVVPQKYLNRIVTNDMIVESPVVSQAYKDMYQRYVNRFGEPPIDVVGEMYNGVKAFLEFLNGQDTMDTTAWMEGFAKYRWWGVWGTESFWCGKPLYGIDRVTLWGFWATEWTGGKPETRWAAPVPYELFVGK